MQGVRRALRRGAQTATLLVLGVWSAAAQAPDDLRIALVIGNAAYPEPATLANPGNDAAAMSATLKTLGFSVFEVRNGTATQMRSAVAKLRETLQGKRAVGLLYYAGHGLQVDFRNYMVPVDAKLASAADVPAQTVDVGQVIEAFKAAGNRMNIVVLDACRDNPFAQGSSNKGLAPLDAPSGTLLAYATAPGNVAEDGDPGTGNGVYTSFLVKELQKPAARIEDVFKRVRLQVRQFSQGRQIPWESTSLEEDFYFNDGVKHTFRPEDLQHVADAARQRQAQLERQATEAKESDRQQAAQVALAQSREAEAQRQRELEQAAAQAREAARIKQMSVAQAREEAFRIEKAEWDRIKGGRNVDDFYAFTKKYPSGSMAELAQASIEALQRAQIRVQADRDGKQQASFLDRYREGDRFEFVQKDGLTGVINGRAVIEVRYVNEDEFDGVVVSGNLAGARGTRAGFILKDGGGTYDPPWSVVPGSDYQVGKRFSGRSIRTDPQGRRIWVDTESRIAAREKLQTAFGLLDTYRIEVLRTFETGGTMKMTFWFEPEWGYSVKLITEFRNGGAPDIRIREMVARARRS
jgi:uncharacterized caspase-like protein